MDASAVEKKDSQDGTKTETATEPMATEKGSRASAAENEEQSLPSGLDEGDEGSGRRASSASSWNSENNPGGSQRNEPWQKQSWDSKNRTHEENSTHDRRWKSASSWNAWPCSPNGDTSHEQTGATVNTNGKKRKPTSFVANFGEGGKRCVFDEVDMTPGWNADKFPYGKKEDVERRSY